MIAFRIATILALAAGSLAAQPRIAGVDVGRAYRGYHKTITMMEEITRQRKELNEDPQLKQLRLLSIEAKEAERAAAKLSGGDEKTWLDARRLAELKHEELRASARAIQEARDTANKQLNRKMVTTSRELLDAVQQAAADLGRERGYDLVVDSTGNTNTGMPLLLHSREMPDLTEAVIARLNAPAPAEEGERTGEQAAETQPDGEDAAKTPEDGKKPAAKPAPEPEDGGQ